MTLKPTETRKRPGVLKAMIVICAALSAASCHSPADRAPGFEGGAKDAVAPESFDRIESLVKQTSAIVHGQVTGISYSYDDCLGPRTVVSLSRVETLAGTSVGDHISLITFGGKLPSGKFVTASELPRYVDGASYVLFLFNRDWRFSPVIGDLAFREETIGGRKVLVDSDGFGVSGIGKLGIERNTARLTEPALNRFASERASIVMDAVTEPLPATPCRAGTQCEPSTTDGDAAAREVLPQGRPIAVAARPAILPGIGPTEVSAAITIDELVAGIGRAADKSGQRLGGQAQLKPRLGCMRVTPTARWRQR
ncbi:hypothetical protein [Pseudomonas putida]|uniref:hypothetical protein n=1 Tax=Pseudomonas putida TaxID=303 RepID=UPI0023668A27|nr:hypothetical protein [Pseudomonas putida]MDD2047566.1 hypothetical protein [Pseudomonas putida]